MEHSKHEKLRKNTRSITGFKAMFYTPFLTAPAGIAPELAIDIINARVFISILCIRPLSFERERYVSSQLISVATVREC